MIKERNYDFRKRIDIVHKSNIRDYTLSAGENELVIDENFTIVIPDLENATTLHAAEDLQSYLFKSMGLSLKIERGSSGKILFKEDCSIQSEGGFRLEVTDSNITISGNEPAGIFNGSIYLQDQLSLREAPYIEYQEITRKKLFTPRIVHSGWGIELFPDSHLNAIAHNGFDAIAVFVTGKDRTNVGVLDINDLISRAKKFGISVILYSYLPGFKNPADSDAEEFFDNVYTRLFEYYPEARGVMLVGESAEFPSSDPTTTGKLFNESVVNGIPDTRPSPGWWPCDDYPAWLQMVANSVRKAKPDALIIFNTYNWGWVSEELREKFLANIPKDIIVQVTFEIFKSVQRESITSSIMDYTISTAEPGFYFTSECKNAAKHGLQLLATANTAGATWDFGVIGHVPVPQQWIKKFEKLDEARRNWGLDKFYDNHHYGWEPSVITDLGKAYFWSPQQDMEQMLKRFAIRDFGKDAADNILKAWELWSQAITYYTPTNEDQYGPCRVGVSYPLIFNPNITRTMANKEIKFPTQEGAHFGWQIIKTLYQPFENEQQAPSFLRHPIELRSLERLEALWQEGVTLMSSSRNLVPVNKLENFDFELNRGEFILRAIRTAINTKRWYTLNVKLVNSASATEANELLDQLEALAQKEIANAQSAIVFVENDSRLGWEPSMEYVCDRWHIEWKLSQMESMLLELNSYRKICNL